LIYTKTVSIRLPKLRKMNTISSNDILASSSCASTSSMNVSSVGDGVDRIIESLSAATPQQLATIWAILGRRQVSELPTEKAPKKVVSKPMKAPTAPVFLSDETPTSASYRIPTASINHSLCVGRSLKGGADKRWSPIVYRESQCASPLVPGSDLCLTCSKRAEKFAETSDKKDWNGRVTEEPPGWAHMLGTEWAAGKKMKFSSSEVVSDSDSVKEEMPAPAPVKETKKATTESKEAKAEAKKAAAEAKEAEKKAKAEAKEAEKKAKAEAKEAEKKAKADAAAAKKAEKKVKSVTPKAEAKVTAASTEVTEVVGELKLIDGTLYMIKTGNVYEYDELSETAGDYVGRLTAEETIDTEAEEKTAEESDTD